MFHFNKLYKYKLLIIINFRIVTYHYSYLVHLNIGPDISNVGLPLPPPPGGQILRTPICRVRSAKTSL